MLSWLKSTKVCPFLFWLGTIVNRTLFMFTRTARLSGHKGSINEYEFSRAFRQWTRDSVEQALKHHASRAQSTLGGYRSSDGGDTPAPFEVRFMVLGKNEFGEGEFFSKTVFRERDLNDGYLRAKE